MGADSTQSGPTLLAYHLQAYDSRIHKVGEVMEMFDCGAMWELLPFYSQGLIIPTRQFFDLYYACIMLS